MALSRPFKKDCLAKRTLSTLLSFPFCLSCFGTRSLSPTVARAVTAHYVSQHHRDNGSGVPRAPPLLPHPTRRSTRNTHCLHEESRIPFKNYHYCSVELFTSALLVLRKSEWCPQSPPPPSPPHRRSTRTHIAYTKSRVFPLRIITTALWNCSLPLC